MSDDKLSLQLREQIKAWRNSYINTSVRKNNLLNQNKELTEAIVLKTNGAFTYETFWQIATDRLDQDQFAFESATPHYDRRHERIEWESEKTGRRAPELLDNIINPGYSAIVQKGENPICLTFGKLTWYVQKKSNSDENYGEVLKREIDGQEIEFIKISTPLIFVPVKLSNVGVNYWLRPITAEANDATLNPALILRYKEEGYDLFPIPECGQLIDFDKFDIKVYFEELEKHFKNVRDEYSFSFDKNYVALDKFDYDRICMYRDVLKHEDEIVQNRILRAFYGEDITPWSLEDAKELTRLDTLTASGILDTLEPAKSFQILDSDSSQCEVIERFKNGESFVLEGPPGTGKTQTIVNMIAEAICRDKKVLFVSGKMSALNTVMKKLQLMQGVNIDKHCLLITGEEESKNNNITDTFGKLQASLTAPPAPFNKQKYEDTLRDLVKSRDLLVGYNQEFYATDNTLKMSIYDIIGQMLLLGYENSYIPVKFANGFIENLTRVELEKHAEIIEDIEKVLLGLIGRSGRIEDDVWYGYKKYSFDEHDKIMLGEYCTGIRHSLASIEDAFDCISTVQEEKLERIISALKQYPLLSMRAVCDADLSKDVQTLYLKTNLDQEIELLEEELSYSANYIANVKRYYAAIENVPEIDPVKIKDLVSNFGSYSEKKISELSIEQIQLSQTYDNVIKLAAGKLEKINVLSIKDLSDLIGLIDDILACAISRKALECEILKVYDESILTYNFLPLLEKFRTSWSENVKNNKTPFMFSGSIKEIKKKCKTVDQIQFTVKYVYELLEQLAAIDAHTKKENAARLIISEYGLGQLTNHALSSFNALLRDYLKEKETYAVNNLFAADFSFKHFIEGRQMGMQKILETVNLFKLKHDITVNEFALLLADYDIVRRENTRLSKNITIQRIFPTLFDQSNSDWQNMLAIIKLIANIKEIIADERRTMQEAGDIFAQTIGALVNKGIFICINKLFEQYISFYSNESWFEDKNIDVHSFDKMTFDDFRNWLRQIEDINHISEYVTYKIKTKEIENTPEGLFFNEYVKAGRRAYPIDNMRNHYVISMLYAYYELLVSKSKFVAMLSSSVVNSVQDTTKKFCDADKQAQLFNRVLVDLKLHSNIARNSSLHNYLGSIPNDKNFSVRRLLKMRSESITQLAPCIMMSVYSVSKLLPYELYKFDVVIFDEASQIPAEDALTSIMRTNKQVVIAGDPKQMPAITYFDAKNTSLRVDYDDEEIAETCDSIIDFVIRSPRNKVKYRGLNMHYRSNHESLIKYSNESTKLYGGKLVTFPSPKPRSEDFGLWNYSLSEDSDHPDRVIVGGGGENESEIQEVLKLIRRHFTIYPLPEKEEDVEKYNAKHSLGIIVFGTKQKSRLVERMKSDSALKKVISYNDNRVFSITTVDEIQGDEMSEMILSLTYGRTPDGKLSQSWGHLNQLPVALYKFNVAVTRARDNLKFVHSVTAKDITNESLSYVSDYLHQFDAVRDSQFVSNVEFNTGFVEAIGKLCEDIVGSERVVYNFGESPRSYRVPISILSKDKQRVVLGIMCEENRGAQGFSVREYSRTCNDILKSHEWKELYETFAIQWIRNYTVEKMSLVERLNGIKNI